MLDVVCEKLTGVGSDVAVVVPAYNAAATIERALESVFSQTLRPVQVIVVDDGSTDDTAAIVSAFSSEITLVKVPNGGVAAARNHGSRLAVANWIAFLDADDTWYPEKLERQFENVRPNAAMLYTDAIVVDGKDRVVLSTVTPCSDGEILEALLLGNFITNSSVVVRADVLGKVGGFRTDLVAVVDWPVWLEIASRHDVQYIDKPLVEYYVQESSITRDVSKTLPAHMSVLAHAFSKQGPAFKLQGLRRAAYARAYGVVAYEAARGRDWSKASRLYLASIRQTPLRMLPYKMLLKTMLAWGGVREW